MTLTSLGLVGSGSDLLASSYGVSGANADNYDALQAAVTAAQNQGKRLLLDLIGTVRLTKAGAGAIKIAPGKPLTIVGPGKGILTIQGSRGVPRLFDCDANKQQNQTFLDHDISGFTYDAANVQPTDLAPLTAVTGNVNIAGGFAWTAVPLASNAAFQDSVDIAWFPATNAGTAANMLLNVRPKAGSSTDVEVQSSTALTLQTGDQLSGAFATDHALYGNRHGAKLQQAADGSSLVTHFSNILLRKIDVINLPATQGTVLTQGKTPSLRFGIGVFPAAAGSIVSKVRYEDVRIHGGDCGTWTVGGAGAFIDDVVHERCFHDRGFYVGANGGASTADYPSLNFMVGGDAWVGRVWFKGCHGKNSGDVGIEVDQPMFCDIDKETLIEDAFSCAYYITNFTAPSRSVAGPKTTTLGAAIADGTATTITLTSIPSGVDQEGYVKIDDETIHYSITSATTMKVRRAILGSVGAAHANGATVTFVEVRRQQINIDGRSRRMNAVFGRGFSMFTNASLPLPPIALGGSHERVHDTVIQGEAVYIDGFTPHLHLKDGYKVNLAGNGSAATGAVYLTWPGNTGSTGVLEVAPSRVQIGDVSMRASGIFTGGSVHFVRLEAGFFDLQVEDLHIAAGIKGLAGQTRCITSGNVTNSVKASIKLTVFGTDQNDAAFAAVRMDGNTNLARLDLDLDLYAMNFSVAAGNGNYIPWASTNSQVVKVRRCIHPFVIASSGAQPYPPNPQKWTGAKTAAYTAAHDDEVIPVDTNAAAGAVPITLPPISGGNASVIPKPGDGARILVLDVSNAAATKNIQVKPTSGEKMQGTVDATFTISTNGGKQTFVGHSTLGWWPV